MAHCYDRAIQAPMERLHRQWQELYSAQQDECQHEGAAYKDWLFSWFVSMGCTAHDCHGGLKWAVLSQFSDKGIMRSGYILVESVANSFDLLLKHVAPWLGKVLAFADWHNDSARELYMSMDCDADFLDTFVDLEVRFSAGRLLVAEKHKDREGLLDLLGTLLLKAWSFRRWSESRWLSLGSCCRSVMLSLFLGLESLVQFVLDAGESRFHLGGFCDNLTAQVREFICVVSVSSRVPDSVLAVLVRDDRVPLVLQEIDAEIDLELTWVASLPDEVWRQLGCVAAQAGPSLRSACLAAALTAAGYVQGKLRPARQGVWRLLSGDRQANLAELAIGDPPEQDELLYKIYEIMRLGFGVDKVLEGLQALSKVSWTTLVVEQGHASASGLMKVHKEYGMATLKARSMLLQFRPLLAQSAEERKLKAAQSMFSALGRKQFNRFKGRHLFLRELNYTCHKRVSQGRRVPTDCHKRFFKKHSKQWASLRPSMKEDFERRAVFARLEAEQEVKERRQELAFSIQRLRQSLNGPSEELGGKVLRVSDARLSDSERMELERLFNSEAFAARHAEDWRRADEQPFVAPSGAVQVALESVELPFQREKPTKLAWVPLMSWNRVFFSTCCVKIIQPDAETFWKFVFGVQNPMMVCMVRLLPLEPVQPLVCCESYEEAWAKSWDHKFQVDWAHFRWSDENVWRGEWPVFILPGATHAGTEVMADGEWISIEQISTWFPPVPRKSTGAEKPRTVAANASVGDSIFAEHPWLESFLQDRRSREAYRGPSSATASLGSAAHGEMDDGAGAYQEVVDCEAVMEALLTKRMALGLEQGSASAEFVVVLRGGPGLFKRTGMAYDEIRGQSANDLAKKWCEVHKLNKSFAATLTAYGDEACRILAEAWVARMQWLYDLSQREGPEFAFSDAALGGFEEDPKVQRLYDEGNRAVKARIATIRGLRPRQ